MDKIPTIKDRIFLFLERKNIKKETFYKETGMSSSNFKGAALKSDLGVDKLTKILKVYPELQKNENLNWLITGNGSLNLTHQNSVPLNSDKDSNEKLGDLLSSLYAQYSTQDKSILFIQKQIERIEKKYDEAIIKQNKYLEEILSQTRLINK